MVRLLSVLLSALLALTGAVTVAPAAIATTHVVPAEPSTGSTYSAGPVIECTHDFVGANGASWTKGSNWSGSVVPDSESIACLSGKTVFIPSGAAISVAAIYGAKATESEDHKATISLNGALTVSQAITGLDAVLGGGTLTILKDGRFQLATSTSSEVVNLGLTYLEQGSKASLGKNFKNQGSLEVGDSTLVIPANAKFVNTASGVISGTGGTISGILENSGAIVTSGEPLVIKRLDWLAGSVAGSFSIDTFTALDNAEPLATPNTAALAVTTIADASEPLIVSEGVNLSARTVAGPVTNRGALTLEADSLAAVRARVENHARLIAGANLSVSAEIANYGVFDIGAKSIISGSKPFVVNHAGGTIAANGGEFTLTAPLTNYGSILARSNGLSVHTLKWHAGEISGDVAGRMLEVMPGASALGGTASLAYDVVSPQIVPPVGTDPEEEYLPLATSLPETPALVIDNAVALDVERLETPLTNYGKVRILAQFEAGIFAPLINHGGLEFESGSAWRAIDASVINHGHLDLGTYSSYRSTNGSSILNTMDGTALINGTSSIDQFSFVNQGRLTVGPARSYFSSLEFTDTARTTVRVTPKSFTPFGSSSAVHLGGSLEIEPIDGYQPEAGKVVDLLLGSKSVTGTFKVPAGWGLEVTATDVSVTRLAPVLSGWSVSGEAKAGSTLEVEPLGWNYDDVQTTYQWTRDGEAIPGASNSSYLVGQQDVGTVLAVQITGVKEYFAVTTLTAYVGRVSQVFETVGTVVVRGDRLVGETLTAAVQGWLPEPTGYSYQWLRDGAPITRAQGKTYTLTSSDRGHRISVETVANRDSFVASVKVSAETQAIVQTNTIEAAPKISGTVRIGKTLTASTGSYAARPTSYSYQWLRNGKSISGATKSTYKLVSADGGRKISVKVTARRAHFTTVSRTSKQTAAVVKIFTYAPTPKVSGTAKVGRTLKVTTGTWKPYKPTYSYRWLRNGKSISGATKSSYKLTKADKGKKISVKVVAKRTGYLSVTRYSKSTSTIR